jgi:EAL domain-containing protein (putative c-di-GMP-specific phosphodiesterase class I)
MGIAVAIDDFGTGYSALSHLQIFPLTTLKIDKSFVQNISTEGNSIALLHSIVGIAKSFDLKVIAEGVETEEQLRVLDAIHCDELQGYLFSRPVPQEALERGLRDGFFAAKN